MRERRVGLDLRLGQGASGTSIAERDFAHGEPTPPDPAAVARFARAFEAAGDGHARETEPATAPLATPSPRRRSSPPSFDHDAALEMLEHMVDTLCVGDGAETTRKVRIDLADAVFPGVTLSVFEDAGAWVASFDCREPQPFIALAGASHAMARRLADTLGQDALWRVIAHELPVGDDEWMHWCDAHWIDTDGQRAGTESFASAPGGRVR